MSDEEIYQEAREKKQQIKHLYGKLYGNLTDLFCRYDSMGLVNMGAPENELLATLACGIETVRLTDGVE